MNEILEQALLFDFYGELLTDHQKEIYGQFIQENQTLSGYEEKLHLVEKCMAIKEKTGTIKELQDGYEKERAEEIVKEIRKISDEIIEEL